MDRALKTSLSDDDIKNYFKGKVNIVKLKDLTNEFPDIEDALRDYNRLVILIETKRNSGHWVSMSKVKSKGGKPYYLWFDSYGLYPQSEAQWIPKYLKTKNEQRYGLLSDWLSNRLRKDIPVHYSEQRLQGKGTSTCGRWCIIRLEHPELTEYQFAKQMQSDPHFTPDELTVLLTQDKLHK